MCFVGELVCDESLSVEWFLGGEVCVLVCDIEFMMFLVLECFLNVNLGSYCFVEMLTV